jgi:hypothetical protein
MRDEVSADRDAAYGFGSAASSNDAALDLFKPCAFCGHDPKNVVLDPQLWTQIVMRGTDDPGLQALIDQAVMGPKR